MDEDDDDPDFSRFVAGTVVPKSLLPAIGYVMVCFSELDRQLDLVIAHLLSADKKVGQAITLTSIHYRPRIELFDRLVDLKISDKDDRNKLKTISKNIGKLAESRHRLVHDGFNSYSWNRDEVYLKRREADFEGQKPIPLSKQSLKELGNRMVDIRWRLTRYQRYDPAWKSGASFPWRDRRRRPTPKETPHPAGERAE